MAQVCVVLVLTQLVFDGVCLQASEPGTIRGDYCIEVGRNVIHGSDSVENAQKEIALWFGGELLGLTLASIRRYTVKFPCAERRLSMQSCITNNRCGTLYT